MKPTDRLRRLGENLCAAEGFALACAFLLVLVRVDSGTTPPWLVIAAVAVAPFILACATVAALLVFVALGSLVLGFYRRVSA